MRPPISLQKDHVLVHNRYTDDEYLIDMRTYHYVVDFVRELHEPLYLLPNDEYIKAQKLISDESTEDCQLRINELIFE